MTVPTMDVDKLPPPKDLSHLLSETTRSRKPSSLKSFYKFFRIPGIGQLAGGLPNQQYFPFDNLSADSALPDRWEPTPNDPVNPPSTLPSLDSLSLKSKPQSSHLLVPKESHAVDRQRKIDVASALQYGTAEGYAPLKDWVRAFVRDHMHPEPQYSGGPEIILTSGNTDGFAKTLQAFNNEWVETRDPIEEREGMLVEKFCYMNAIQAAESRGMTIVPVNIDDEGMCADGVGGLLEVLETWNPSKGKRPHLLYTVTVGQNPTSGVLSLSRRRDIYALCSKYDIIICEDDPYWFLQYPSATSTSTSSTPEAISQQLEQNQTTRKSSGYSFLDSLVPSYVSVDTEGRVIRLDTFSKTVAPGCRLGWITAQPAIIERLLRITETTTQQPSGFVQSLICELLSGPLGPAGLDHGRGGGPNGTGYKHAGWVRWLSGLRGNYERRMTIMNDILESGCRLVDTYTAADESGISRPSSSSTLDESWSFITPGPQIYSFIRPAGGMFLWLRVLFSNHPLFTSSSASQCFRSPSNTTTNNNTDNSTNPTDKQRKFTAPQLSRALFLHLTKAPYKVLISPGGIFGATAEIREEEGWEFFRVCFAAVEEAELEDVSVRLREGLRGFWGLGGEGVGRLLDEDDAGGEGEDGGGRVDLGSFMRAC